MFLFQWQNAGSLRILPRCWEGEGALWHRDATSGLVPSNLDITLKQPAGVLYLPAYLGQVMASGTPLPRASPISHQVEGQERARPDI